MTPLILPNLTGICCALVLIASHAEAAITLTPSTIGRVTTAGAATVTTLSGNSLNVGDSSNNTQVFASIINFEINTSAADIGSATQITFTITPKNQLGTGPDVRLIAFDPELGNNAIETGDASASGTIVATIAAADVLTAMTAGQPLTFDVTAFVKASSLSGSSYASFRLESPATANDGDNGSDVFVFGTIGGSTPDIHDARLTIIPEPSGVALITFATAIGLVRRRR